MRRYRLFQGTSILGLVVVGILFTAIFSVWTLLVKHHLADMRSLALLAHQQQHQQVYLLGTIQATLVQMSKQLDRPVSLSVPGALPLPSPPSTVPIPVSDDALRYIASPGRPLGSGICRPRDALLKEDLRD